MRQRFTVAPGESLRGIGLPAGQMHGIEVDNPSGQWLSIPAIDAFVPPYTLGWAQPLPNGMASIDIIATSGPAGQISTTTGDPITVYLTSNLVGASAGASSGDSFINRDLQPTLLSYHAGLSGNFANLRPTTLQPIAGSQLRIFTVSLGWTDNGVTPSRPNDIIEVQMKTYGASAFFMETFVIHANIPRDQMVYSPPRDIPLGVGVEFTCTVGDVADLYDLNVIHGRL